MNSIRTRVTKEVRTVFPVWILVAIAGLIPRFVSYGPGSELWPLLSVLGFYVGIPLLAAFPTGYEFHSRTFSSLFTQPIDRRSIWAMKMSVTALAVPLAGCSYLFGWGRELQADPETTIVGIIWLLMTVCTAQYWALVARSIIGGLLLSVMQGILIVVGFIITASLRKGEAPFFVGDRLSVPTIAVWIGIALMYSLVMLWLGRRAFIRFQDRGSQHKDSLSGRPRFAYWPHSRRSAPLFNLIGKEVRLLWPVWMFTSLGILATAGLALWRQSADPEGLLRAVPITEFMVIVATLSTGLAVLLSGTLSMGEEKELGVHAWHTTLPISLRTQWLVKFGFALFTGLLGTGPLFVIGTGLVESPPEADRLLDPALLWLVSVTVVLGFWCAVLTRGTSRALLWLCPVIAMAMVGGKVGIELSLITKGRRLLTWIGFHPTQIEGWSYYELFPGGLVPLVLVLSVLLVAAVQSYRLFRIETQEGHRPLIRAIIPLVFAAVLGGFLQGTLGSALWPDL